MAKGDRRYLPIFRDHRVIGQWLPKTMYITRFETSAFRPLATFEEDIDVTSGTERGVVLRGDSLAVWREATLELRSSNRSNTSASQENQAVTVGWNNRIQGADTTSHGPPARYSLRLPSGLASAWNLSSSTTLDFMLGPTHEMPGPRRSPAAESDSTKADEDRAGRRGGRDSAADDEKPEADLSIEIEDASGTSARVTLSHYGPLRRPLETWVMRRADRETSRFQNPWELILQSYSIPLGDFEAVTPEIGRAHV